MRHLDDFVPANHQLRPIKQMVSAALLKMDALLGRMYAADIKGGRPSIAPEKPIRAMLLQVSRDDSAWVASVFRKNRERLIEHDTVIELFNLIVQQADEQQLLSGEHFSVEGSLIQAWAGHKRFVRKDRPDGDGQPARPDRQRPCDAGRWVRRTRAGQSDDQ